VPSWFKPLDFFLVLILNTKQPPIPHKDRHTMIPGHTKYGPDQLFAAFSRRLAKVDPFDACDLARAGHICDWDNAGCCKETA